jgi:hypothetical protein
LPKLNSGLDILFIQLSKEHQLVKFRFLKSKYSKISTQGINLNEIYVQKKDLLELKKLAKKTGLVKFHSDKFFQFVSEERYLKNVLKLNEPVLNSRKILSITQKVFLYTVAQNYRLDEKYNPKTLQDWKGHSWTIIALSVLENTSQSKIATYLGRSRESINRSLKHNAFNLYVGNNFLEVSESLLGKGMNIKTLRNKLNRGNLKGYRLNHEGKLVKQLPNSYKLKNKCSIKFINRATFYYSNKRLNKSFQINLEDSKNCTQKSVKLTKVKLISMLRLKRRSKVCAKVFGDKSGLNISALEMNKRIMKEKNLTFKTKHSKKEINYTKVFFEKFPNKWTNDLYKLKISGIKLREDVFINSLNKRYLRKIKRPMFIIKGKNFKTATCKGFHRNQRILDEYEAIKTPELSFEYGHLKKMQREYFEFIGKSLFKNNNQTGVQSIMCNVA